MPYPFLYTSLWTTAVVNRPAFPIMVSDSEDLQFTSPSPALRGTLTERLRFDDKVSQGIINSRRALKAHNLRRAKHWMHCAEHWLKRRREIFTVN